MRKLVLSAFFAGASIPAFEAYYNAEDFNGWNASGLLMNETATGSGVYTAAIQATPGRHGFKITIGNWSVNWPPANSWAFVDSSGSLNSFSMPALS